MQTKSKERANDYADSARFFAVLAIMMGVGRSGFCIETVADDGGLELADGPRHAPGSPRTILEENLTLARALELV